MQGAIPQFDDFLPQSHLIQHITGGSEQSKQTVLDSGSPGPHLNTPRFSLALYQYSPSFPGSVCNTPELYAVLICSKVDQEIVKVIEQRARACQQREGPSYKQNCVKELQQFNEVSRAYQSRCECTYKLAAHSFMYSDFMFKQRIGSNYAG